MGRFSWDVWLDDYTNLYKEKEKRWALVKSEFAFLLTSKMEDKAMN